MSKAPGFVSKILKENKAKKSKLDSKFKGESILYAGDPAFHWGTGGYNRGKSNLLYGPRGSGKSTLALRGAAAEQQKTNGWVIIFDSEHYYGDPHEVDEDGKPTEVAQKFRERFAKLGLNWEKVVVRSSNRASHLFHGLDELMKEMEDNPELYSALVVDSWGGIQGEHAFAHIGKGEKDANKAGNKFGGNAKTIGVYVQFLLDMCAKAGVTQFYVQHCMMNPDGWPKYVLLGGQKLQFLVHNIIFLESSEAKDGHLLFGDVQSATHAEAQENLKVGKLIRFKVEKSRNVVEGRKGEFFFNFETGQFALPEQSLFNLAAKLNVIDQAGAWFSYPKGVPNPAKFQGTKQFVAALQEDKSLYNDIWNDCLKSSAMDASGDFEFGDVASGGKDEPKKSS